MGVFVGVFLDDIPILERSKMVPNIILNILYTGDNYLKVNVTKNATRQVLNSANEMVQGDTSRLRLRVAADHQGQRIYGSLSVTRSNT